MRGDEQRVSGPSYDCAERRAVIRRSVRREARAPCRAAFAHVLMDAMAFSMRAEMTVVQRCHAETATEGAPLSDPAAASRVSGMALVGIR